MKALSLQEPYAWLILQRSPYEENPKKPLKPIENRGWPLPGTMKLPARIYVHASLGLYNISLSTLKEILSASEWFAQFETLRAIYSLWELYHNEPECLKRFRYFGHILGEITVTGQVTESDDRWFFGPFGYTLESPQLYDTPIPCKGKLWFFEPDIAQEQIKIGGE